MAPPLTRFELRDSESKSLMGAFFFAFRAPALAFFFTLASSEAVISQRVHRT